jgi:uncharacterized protein
MTHRIGTIGELWRFPVKSMQGERVSSVGLGPLGIEGDRRWALRDVTNGKIISAKVPKLGTPLLTCSASIDAAGATTVFVGETSYRVPDEIEAIDAALSGLLGRAVHLEAATTNDEVYESEWPELPDMALSGITLDLSLHRGTFADLSALHLISSASLAHLASLAEGSEIDVRRFRPSMVVTVDVGSGFVENDWIDRRARVGEAIIAFGAASPRCIMTTVAQPGLPRDVRVLQTIAAHNKRDFGGFGNFACLGIYAEVVEPGPVSIGDAVELIDA